VAAHLPEALHFISLQLACHACIALQQDASGVSSNVHVFEAYICDTVLSSATGAVLSLAAVARRAGLGSNLQVTG
jgi:hypothetical protein